MITFRGAPEESRTWVFEFCVFFSKNFVSVGLGHFHMQKVAHSCMVWLGILLTYGITILLNQITNMDDIKWRH